MTTATATAQPRKRAPKPTTGPAVGKFHVDARTPGAPGTAAHADDPRPVVAMDWSVHSVHVTFDGDAVEKLPDPEALLARLTDPHRVVAESTIESWDPVRRQQVAEKFRLAGHELLVYRPIHTARMRNTHGAVKSDEVDARVIYRIAAEGRLHLYPLPADDLTWAAKRTAVNDAYVRLRLTGRKPELAALAADILGDYRDLDPDAQLVLGNGTTYLESVTAAVLHAALHAASRTEFERLLGLHGSAYPSILRSEVHHHGYRHAHTRRDVGWATFRRHLRRAYAEIKTYLATHPDTIPVDLTDLTDQLLAAT